MAIDLNYLDKYILEVNLDYICIICAFDKYLIKKAAAITFAKESTFVKSVNYDFKDALDKDFEDKKFFYDRLTAEEVLNRLIEVITQVD